MTMKAELITLLRKRWVTPILALEQCQCFSLSQRVGELIRDGVVVMKDWRTLPNGKKVRAYRIAGGGH